MDIIANEVHKQTRKPNYYRKATAYFINDIWSADIVEMNSEGMAKQNNDYKYILVVIDIFSRFSWTRQLKNKTAIETANAFKSIIKEAKAKPINLWVDEGKEFYNKEVKNVMEGVKMYSTYGEGKAAYVERLNRTLKNMMYKQFTIQMSRKWIDILDDITQQYNNKVHSSTGLKPIDIYYKNKDVTIEIKANNETKPKFNVGDRVRISYKRRPVFDKAYFPNWTWEIFTISKINNSSPITYKIKDYENNIIEGSFYENELQKTKQKEDTYLIESIIDEKTMNKKKYYLVKWLGYKKPTWEPAENIKDLEEMK